MEADNRYQDVLCASARPFNEIAQRIGYNYGTAGKPALTTKKGLAQGGREAESATEGI